MRLPAEAHGAYIDAQWQNPQQATAEEPCVASNEPQLKTE